MEKVVKKLGNSGYISIPIKYIGNKVKVNLIDKELLLVDVNLILTTKVKPFGNSAHIPIPKKYVNKECKVVILKEQEEK